jgi:hypothetical protein
MKDFSCTYYFDINIFIRMFANLVIMLSFIIFLV